jgi:hypothetical protein
VVPPPDDSVFIGEKGIITTGTYGEETRLIPVAKMADYKFPEPLLTSSPGHYRDWIRAFKGGDAACSNFKVAAPFPEWMLLGVIALRVEGKLEWDAANALHQQCGSQQISETDVLEGLDADVARWGSPLIRLDSGQG